MPRNAFSATVLALLCLAVAAPALASGVPPAIAAAPSPALASPNDPMVILGRLTAGANPVLRCSDAVAAAVVIADPHPVEPRRPQEGNPIDLGNGCGCPSLSFPWVLTGHNCVLSADHQTCSGVCIWTRFNGGIPISWPTECGTL